MGAFTIPGFFKAATDWAVGAIAKVDVFIPDALAGAANKQQTIRRLKKANFADFRWAAEKGDLDEVTHLLKEAESVGYKQKMLEALWADLGDVTKNGHLGVVIWLLQEAYLADSQQKIDFFNALCGAALGGHSDIVEFLLKEADLAGNKQQLLEREGFKVGLIAAGQGYTHIVELLCTHIRQENKPKLREACKLRAFLRAAENGQVEQLEQLLNENYLTETKQTLLKTSGLRALCAAIKNNHTNIAKLLLAAAPIEDRQSLLNGVDGKWVAYAIQHNNAEMMDCLFHHADTANQQKLLTNSVMKMMKRPSLNAKKRPLPLREVEAAVVKWLFKVGSEKTRRQVFELALEDACSMHPLALLCLAYKKVYASVEDYTADFNKFVQSKKTYPKQFHEEQIKLSKKQIAAYVREISAGLIENIDDAARKRATLSQVNKSFYYLSHEQDISLVQPTKETRQSLLLASRSLSDNALSLDKLPIEIKEEITNFLYPSAIRALSASVKRENIKANAPSRMH